MGVCTKSTDLVLKKVKVSVAVGNDDDLRVWGGLKIVRQVNWTIKYVHGMVGSLQESI